MLSKLINELNQAHLKIREVIKEADFPEKHFKGKIAGLGTEKVCLFVNKMGVEGFLVGGDSGVISNWFPAAMNIDHILREMFLTLPVSITFDQVITALGSVTVNCVEQAFMLIKSFLANDLDSAKKIMTIPSPGDMRKIGRALNMGDNMKYWDDNKFEIVSKFVEEKFIQNPILKEWLIATGDAIIAEARDDKEWGTGLIKDDPNTSDESKWIGNNLLGRALMKARQNIIHTSDFCLSKKRRCESGASCAKCASGARSASDARCESRASGARSASDASGAV